jgi:hypothetical protein
VETVWCNSNVGAGDGLRTKAIICEQTAIKYNHNQIKNLINQASARRGRREPDNLCSRIRHTKLLDS